MFTNCIRGIRSLAYIPVKNNKPAIKKFRNLGITKLEICDVVEIPRLEKDSGAISASRVRKFLKDGNFEEIRKIVPEATFRYLRKYRGKFNA